MRLGLITGDMYRTPGAVRVLSTPMPRRPKKANEFCEKSDLDNEATVEQFFVNRLLAALGYSDSMIEPKKAVPQETVQIGHRRKTYYPDYILSAAGERRWVCEAKATSESVDDGVEQGVSYCLKLRRKYNDPITHFVVTNGIVTKVFKYDEGEPILTLKFEDFVDGNAAYEQFRELLNPANVSGEPEPAATTIRVRRKSASEINADFAWCHSLIHRREGLGYSASFMELVKIVFLKLLSDRELHQLHPTLAAGTEKGVDVPATDVKFSVDWIERQEPHTSNPVNDIQFKRLLHDLEIEIVRNNKKRIFAPDAALGLRNATIKEIAERLQGADLLAIDADLNGRLFETFLNATLRGRDLGQFFTPRSVVKLGVALADITVTASHQDVVLDACCGTGGFLIDALADMWRKVDDISSLSVEKQDQLRASIAHQNVVGIDVARDPALARIARINMFLHGDGGSRIYQVDALDKNLAAEEGDGIETTAEKDELADLIGEDGFADVVLTNPPFAKHYKRSKDSKKPTPEDRILDEYDLAFDETDGARKPKKELSSGIMFMERYHDMLKPGGRIVTVIDDSVLGGRNYAAARKWMRDNYIIEGVVSLPGDAFQRSQARVKTSILIMRKRNDEEDVETQPAVFMAYATAVGIDDPARTRVLPGDADLRREANEEIQRLGRLFREFREGKQSAEVKKWTVPAANIQDRLDVKGGLLEAGSRVPTWKRKKLKVVKLSDLVEVPNDSSIPDDADLVSYLRIQYNGFAESGDEIVAEDGPHGLRRVVTDDLVVSHINAVHGAVAVVPPHLDQHVVTNEFTILNPIDPDLDPRIIWMLLRSPQARADMLVLSTGMGRTRVRWDEIAELKLPFPSDDLAAEMLNQLDAAEKARQAAASALAAAQSATVGGLDLNAPEAHDILAAFKPPR